MGDAHAWQFSDSIWYATACRSTDIICLKPALTIAFYTLSCEFETTRMSLMIHSVNNKCVNSPLYLEHSGLQPLFTFIERYLAVSCLFFILAPFNNFNFEKLKPKLKIRMKLSAIFVAATATLATASVPSCAVGAPLTTCCSRVKADTVITRFPAPRQPSTLLAQVAVCPTLHACVNPRTRARLSRLHEVALRKSAAQLKPMRLSRRPAPFVRESRAGWLNKVICISNNSCQFLKFRDSINS